MKTFKLIAILVLLFSESVVGQIPVTDGAVLTQLTTWQIQQNYQVANKNWLDGLRHSETLQQWYNSLEFARNALQTAKETKAQIEGVYYIEQDFQRALQAVQNVNGLTYADLAFFTKLLVDVDINPVNYIPRVPATSQYIQSVNQAIGGTTTSRNVYYSFNSLNRFSNGVSALYNDYSRKTQAGTAKQNNAIKLSLEETKGQLKMEQIIMLNQKIEKNLKDATEMKRIANDSNVKISEAERVQMNAQANKLMEDAITMRSTIADLMSQLNTFSDRPITKGLFESAIHSQVSRELSYAAYAKIR